MFCNLCNLIGEIASSYNFLNLVFFLFMETMLFLTKTKGHVTHLICIINAHVFVRGMNDDTCCQSATFHIDH